MTPSPNPQSLAQNVSHAIETVTGAGPAGLHEPYFGGREWDYVKDCLDSTFVSSVGVYVDRFEAGLAAFTGAKHAIAVSNGTSALHIAFKLAGVDTGMEVLIPALTFVATANAITYCGAIPHFVDSTETNLGIDADKLRTYLTDVTETRDGQRVNKQSGRTIRALVPMHTFGHPNDMDALCRLADEFGLVIVEDAAEGLGSYYRDRHVGIFGLLGTLSFNGNKTITTGGGGAILTSDSDLARRAKHLTTTAKVPHAWEYYHDEIGYNYRMPNLNAALGCAQLEQLPDMLQEKHALYESYAKAFAGLNHVRLISEPEHCKSNYWLQTLILDPDMGDLRDDVLATTNEAGLMTRPAWTLLHLLPAFRDCPRMDLSCAESLSRRLINIPSSAQLSAKLR